MQDYRARSEKSAGAVGEADGVLRAERSAHAGAAVSSRKTGALIELREPNRDSSLASVLPR